MVHGLNSLFAVEIAYGEQGESRKGDRVCSKGVMLGQMTSNLAFSAYGTESYTLRSIRAPGYSPGSGLFPRCTPLTDTDCVSESKLRQCRMAIDRF